MAKGRLLTHESAPRAATTGSVNREGEVGDGDDSGKPRLPGDAADTLRSWTSDLEEQTMDEKTPMDHELPADKTDGQDGGVVIPFRRPTRTSKEPTVETEAEATVDSVLPAHDDPAFEALHRKGVEEMLRASVKSRALLRDPPEKTPS
jgi:hypothetical protein